MSKERVLVTGASSGIGWELAKLFAADGSDLVLVARSEDKLNELANELKSSAGVDVVVLPIDLAEPNAATRIQERLGGTQIDVLVNNAGFGAVGSFTSLPVERQVNMIQVNVAALTHLTRLFLPAMIERKCGGVLNVASTAAFQPGPMMAVYYATKAYVLSFSDALVEELTGTGVTVTCLAPGATATGFGQDSGMDKSTLFKMGTMSSTTVAKAGHNAFRGGKSLIIPGLINKVGAISTRFTPRVVLRKIVRQLQKVE